MLKLPNAIIKIQSVYRGSNKFKYIIYDTKLTFRETFYLSVKLRLKTLLIINKINSIVLNFFT